MNEHTVLGIGIPTYKRPEQLLACVRSILVSARPLGVPIYIVDDSTDDTNREALEVLGREYAFLHVVTNDRNLGIDRNILKAADVCPCEYVWLMGEDDRMTPDAVPRVLALLERDRPMFLYVNYSAVDDGVDYYIKQRSLDLPSDGRMPARDFFEQYAWSMAFLGACVIRKSDWNAVDPAPYIDTWYAHVGRIMEMVSDGNVSLLAESLVLNRCGTPEAFTWTRAVVDVLTGWQRLCEALVPLYGNESCARAVQAFERAHGLGTLKFMGYLRADRVYNLQVYREMVQAEPRSRAYHLLARLIAVLPAGPFRVARFVLMQWRRWLSPPLPLADEGE